MIGRAEPANQTGRFACIPAATIAKTIARRRAAPQTARNRAVFV
jgi:hypothetical protein